MTLLLNSHKVVRQTAIVLLLCAGLVASVPLSLAFGKDRSEPAWSRVVPQQTVPGVLIYGEAFIDGTPVATGTTIEATCDTFTISTTTFALVSGSPSLNYAVAMNNDNPLTDPIDGCVPWQDVTFTVDGLAATVTDSGTTSPMTVTWTSSTFPNVDLTGTRATATPTVTVEPTATDTPTPSFVSTARRARRSKNSTRMKVQKLALDL